MSDPVSEQDNTELPPVPPAPKKLTPREEGKLLHDTAMKQIAAMCNKLSGNIMTNYQTLVSALVKIISYQSLELALLHELETGVRAGTFTQDSLNELLTAISDTRSKIQSENDVAAAGKAPSDTK